MTEQATTTPSAAPRRPPPPLRGEEHHAAVLSDDDVLTYREFVREGVYGVNDIAKISGKSWSTIANAVYGKTWSHLPGAVPRPGSARPKPAAKSTKRPKGARPKARRPAARTPRLVQRITVSRGTRREQLTTLVIQGLQALLQLDQPKRRRSP